MFGTIRKHQNWLWAIIITLTVVSFVIYFSPYSRTSNARRSTGSYGSINGVPVSREDLIDARREVVLRYFFMRQSWPDESVSKELDDDAYRWLLIIQKQKLFGIHLGTEAVAQLAREMVTPLQRIRVNSTAMFVEQVLKPHGFQIEDLERFVRHYAGIQEMIAAMGLCGKLVTPAELKGLYEREHQELDTEAVFFSLSNYLAAISAPADAVARFYTNQSANYRLPDRVQVSYVEFPLSNFTAQAEMDLKTNLTELIEENFKQLGTNYTRVAKTPEEAKAKIREELIRSRALPPAIQKAREFASRLYDINPVLPENLDNFARTNGLSVRVTAPFDRRAGPKEFEVAEDFTKVAFSRTAEEPFAPPIVGRDGVYVIGLNKKLPSENPTFDFIRDQVEADYKRNEARNAARRAGAQFSQTLSNSLAQGKSFTALCTNASLKPVNLPPFSLSTREVPEAEDHISLDGRFGLKEIAFSTPPGTASGFQTTADGGMVLFVKARLPIDQAKMKADLPAFMAYVRQNRQTEAFNTWFNKEMQKGLIDTPLARPPQQQPGTASMPKTGKS